MKNVYLNPELKIVAFDSEDVITTSGGSLLDNLGDLVDLDTNKNNIIDGSEW